MMIPSSKHLSYKVLVAKIDDLPNMVKVITLFGFEEIPPLYGL